MKRLGSANEPAQTPTRPRFATGLRRFIDFGRYFFRPATVFFAVAGWSCVDAVSVVSDGPTPAAQKVGQLTDAFAARFTSPERSGRFETSRRRLVSGALIPSRVFGDPSIWSQSVAPSTRLLTAHGTLTEKGYRFDMVADASATLKVGDTRHTISLRQLTDNEFRWDTSVDFAVGSITAADVAAMFSALLVSGHDHEAPGIRASARAAFPRSSAVLSRVFSIDSLAMRPGGQGTTVIGMTIGIAPDGLRATAPHFADYIAKYVAKSRYRFSLADRSGAVYFDATGGKQGLTIRYRVKAGAIVSYLGPPRALPDTLRLTSDLTMHVKMFDVGWKSLVSDFVIHRTEHSRGWSIISQSEPDWQLPMITERLLRSPLRRPFEGPGASFEIGVVDSAGGQTLITRHTRLEVKESPILRFIGSLMSRVFDDLDGAVEREEAAYVRELMVAFQQDAIHAGVRSGLPHSKNAEDH